MDSILSFTTLIAAIINYIWHLSLEGYLGAIISIVIIKSAVEMLKETVDSMLGERADKSLIRYGTDEASVEAVFEDYSTKDISLYLDDMGEMDAIKRVAKERGVAKSVVYKEYHDRKKW